MPVASYAAAVLMTIVLASPALAAPRIGDEGSAPDPSKFDPNYPLMAEWASAGVTGGIPARDKTPAVATVKPGEDIQAAIDAAAPTADKPAAILLAAGVHTRTKPLKMKSHLILRGEDRDKTVLEYDNPGGKNVGEAVRMEGLRRAGLENFTLRNARITAMPRDKWVGVYEPNPTVKDLPPGGDYAAIDIRNSKDCWLDGLNILNSVSRPLRIHAGSSHVTMRDTLIDGAFYKGAGGSGYCEIIGATHTLYFNNTVRNIRHVCLDGNCDYTVIKDCRLQVDLNWHTQRPMGKVLVETSRSYLHPWHWWRTISRYSDPVSEGNLIFRHDPWCKNLVQFDKESQAPAVGGPDFAASVYTLRTNYNTPPWVYKLDKPAPKAGTLYAVTGAAADDAEDAAAAKLFHEVLIPALSSADAQALSDACLKITKPHPGTLAAYYAQDVLDILAEAAAVAGKETGPAAQLLARSDVYNRKGLFLAAKAVAKEIVEKHADAPQAGKAKERVESLTKAGY